MKPAIRAFDPAAYLKTPAARAAYLSEAFETGDVAFIADALGVVARAEGMTRIARDTDLSREALYRALSSNGNPELSTVLKVTAALGLKLKIEKTSDMT
ncbi:MAG: putative addiction module antidote protein [Alphaproteobacteria bacterium]|nr:putative addiction module antidote protein [Alphaproteobacteria bacterium]